MAYDKGYRAGQESMESQFQSRMEREKKEIERRLKWDADLERFKTISDAVVRLTNAFGQATQVLSELDRRP